MSDEIKPSAVVLALAEKVKGVPYKWREGEQEIVIVFKDGRKMKFAREVGAIADEKLPTPSVPDKPKHKKKEK